MKKIMKWVAIILGTLAVCGFLAFLYFIPPFTLVPPEEFSNPMGTVGPSLDNITDPAIRALAKRGQYIVRTYDCGGCHTPFGPDGPMLDKFLAGGNKGAFSKYGTFYTRNLTSDKETGLGRRTDAEVLRVLQTGLLPEGRVAHVRDMPWGSFANWTMEDRYAVMVYLRHLTPVRHSIPDDDTTFVRVDPTATEIFYGTNFGVADEGK